MDEDNEAKDGLDDSSKEKIWSQKDFITIDNPHSITEN